MAKGKSVGRSIGIALVSVAALLGLAGAGMAVQKAHDENKFTYPWENSSSNSAQTSSSGDKTVNVSNTIVTNGVAVRQLTTSTDASGNEVQTFTYAVTPSNADQSVSISLGWTDAAVTKTIGDYLTASLDQANTKISITKKADFSNQATLVVKSKSDETKKASVAIDCTKKFLGWKTQSQITSATNGYGLEHEVDVANHGFVWNSNAVKSTGPTFLSGGSYPTTLTTNGYSTVYSKDVNFTFSYRISTPATFTLALGQDSADGVVVTNVNGAPTVDLSSYCSDGVTIAESEFKTKIQGVYDAGTSDFKSNWSTALASIGSLAIVVLKSTATITCTASDGQSANYSLTVRVCDDASSYSF